MNQAEGDTPTPAAQHGARPNATSTESPAAEPACLASPRAPSHPKDTAREDDNAPSATGQRKTNRVFWEVLGAVGVAVSCFMAGYAVRADIVPWVGAVSALDNEEQAPPPQWLMDFFLSYVSPESSESYVGHYAQFVKPYYTWNGGATREQIQKEHDRYLRSYDVAELELLRVTPLTASADYSLGVHEFLLTCRRLRKHRGKDDLAREIVRIGITTDLSTRPPKIVGVRTINQLMSQEDAGPR